MYFHLFYLCIFLFNFIFCHFYLQKSLWASFIPSSNEISNSNINFPCLLSHKMFSFKNLDYLAIEKNKILNSYNSAFLFSIKTWKLAVWKKMYLDSFHNLSLTKVKPMRWVNWKMVKTDSLFCDHLKKILLENSSFVPLSISYFQLLPHFLGHTMPPGSHLNIWDSTLSKGF